MVFLVRPVMRLNKEIPPQATTRASLAANNLLVRSFKKWFHGFVALFNLFCFGIIHFITTFLLFGYPAYIYLQYILFRKYQ
ncbi:MAG TPA: hypothetical protein DCQ14_03075 [Firmicutes bacterium]|nr:hypothetical protein [Bacillota bacterium]